MARLFSREFTRQELLRRAGNADQFASVRLSRLQGGRSEGVLVADFRTGSGLSFTVAPDRAMDITHGDFRGMPLCWRSATGDVAPTYYEPEGLGWLRGFCGGILATCGLTYLGAPCEDEGEPLGLHGRISNTPADNVLADTRWDGDDLILFVQGKVREAAVFGPNIVLSRTISAKLGGKSFAIHDAVTNEGQTTQPHMILYHFNMGYPAVSEDSEFLSPSAEILPRDADAREVLDKVARFDAPIDGEVERVFEHRMNADGDGRVMAAIVNRALRFGVFVRYNRGQLPRFAHWRMCASGHYVCGMEPANCFVTGRDKARAKGELQFLEPGETRHYDLEFGVLSSEEEIADAEATIWAVKS
jgi:hypothetical protein